MRIGVDYYPEHWDRSLWEADVDLMKKTGVKLVRLAEFAWCRMEPEEGRFSFEWLDEAVRLFAERQIDVVLCTPTSCPPLWLYEKYPDSVMVEKDGTPTRIGVRGHRCINHPAVRKHSEQMIEEMTKHYADNPAVVAWQIDNELEAYQCYCGICGDKFREWMRKKYGSLEAINKAYGNVVWSGEYSSWEQIQPPYGHYQEAWMNPAFMLDYSRFASDNMIEFSNWQAALIRKNCPGIPVTTNVWFSQHVPDFYKEFSELDFVAYDNYPTAKIPEDPETCYTHAFHLDMMRGVKRQPFWVMEELSGGTGCWGPMGRTPEPGMIRGYALQAFAHGADTVAFFRWRTANIGAEMHWHGLIDHSNVPGRRFREFAELCKKAESLTSWQGAENRADVAILLSIENENAFRIQPQTEDYYYLEQPQRLHAAFMALGMNVDIIGQHEDLDGYRIVCAPEMYIRNSETSKRLHDFAERGGTVILTTRSGVKDEHNNAIMEPLPTIYRDLAGTVVTEYDPIGPDSVPVVFADGTAAAGRQWCDILETEGAEILARYDGEYFRDTAAVTRNVYGKGKVYYIATVGNRALYNRVIRDAAEEAKLPYIKGIPERVEIVTRTGPAGTVRFIFNNDTKQKEFTLEGESITLEPFETKIIRMD